MLDSLIQSRPCTIYVNKPHNNDVTSKTSLVSRLPYLLRIYQLSQLTIAIGDAQFPLQLFYASSLTQPIIFIIVAPFLS